MDVQEPQEQFEQEAMDEQAEEQTAHSDVAPCQTLSLPRLRKPLIPSLPTCLQLKLL